MENNQDEISLKEIVQKTRSWIDYLKIRWKLIFFSGLIGGIIGLGYSFAQKTKYTAKLNFVLEEKGSASNGISSIAAQFGLGGIGGGEGSVFSGGNMIELLKSRFLIEKTLLSTVNVDGHNDLLINRYISFNKLDQKWSKSKFLADLKFTNSDRTNFSLQHDSVLGVISESIVKSNLTIALQDKKLNIINITVTSTDEIFAKIFTEKLIETASDFYIENKTKKSRGNVMVLQNRVDSVQQELNLALYGRAQFGDQNTSLIRQQAAVPKLKQEMKVQMLSTLYTELVKNLEFSKLTLMREEPLVQIIDKPILPLPKKNVSKIKAAISGSIVLCFLSLFLLISNKVWRDITN